MEVTPAGSLVHFTTDIPVFDTALMPGFPAHADFLLPNKQQTTNTNRILVTRLALYL
jgi:hypothetical protein